MFIVEEKWRSFREDDLWPHDESRVERLGMAWYGLVVIVNILLQHFNHLFLAKGLHPKAESTFRKSSLNPLSPTGVVLGTPHSSPLMCLMEPPGFCGMGTSRSTGPDIKQ